MIPLNDIPPITNLLGRHWRQCDLSDIVVTPDAAFIPESAIRQLSDYSHSMPSGVYPGKMWRATFKLDGPWLLWYGALSEDGQHVEVCKRLIKPVPDDLHKKVWHLVETVIQGAQ